MDNENNNFNNDIQNNDMNNFNGMDNIDPNMVEPQNTIDNYDNNVQDNFYDYYDDSQTNLNKSINNHTDIVNNYNQVSNEYIDDTNSVNTYEEQLNGSQDLDIYTQQPTNNVNEMDYIDEDFNGNYTQNEFNTQQDVPVQPMNTGYDNGYIDNNQYVDNGYGNGYVDNNQYMDNGYVDNNQYVDNGYGNGYVDNNQYMDNGYVDTNQYVDNGYGNGYVDNNQYIDNTYDNNYVDNSQYTNNDYSNSFINNEQNSYDFDNSEDNNKEFFSDGSRKPKTIGPDAFEKKYRKNLRPFNFMLFIIYGLIIGVIGFFIYSLFMSRNTFYFSKDKINLVIGSSYEEKVYVKGNQVSVENYEWSSTDDTVATVDSSGKISAIKEGYVEIKVTDKKSKKSNLISVKVIDLEIKQFIIKPSEKVVYMGNTYTVVPLINGLSSYTIDMEWVSSDPSVATVDQYGLVTPLKTGHTNVTVTIPNTKYKATISIIVSNKK